jgi:hypothetical protein
MMQKQRIKKEEKNAKGNNHSCGVRGGGARGAACGGVRIFEKHRQL